MKLQNRWKIFAPALMLAFIPLKSIAGPVCLPHGDTTSVLGATVATFESFGIDPTATCITNSLWTDPTGFALGSYVKGAEGLGGTPSPTTFGFNGATVDGTFAGNANARDGFWVQDNGNGTTFTNAVGASVAGGQPSKGIVWDLGGQANQAAIFVQVDHGPVPKEVLENTVWLSNDPNAADSGWTQAFLDTVYLQGWSPGANIFDGFTPVYRLPGSQTFRYVSVSWEGPGSIAPAGNENEIDAVGGLTVSGTGLHSVPEPTTLALLGLGLATVGSGFRRNSRKKRC